MRFVSLAETEAVFDWDEAIERVLAVYSVAGSAALAPGRVVIAPPGRSMRCMSAITPAGRYMGSKHLVKARGGQITYAITLFDQDDGRLAYVMDGAHITALRTAATSAAALRLLPELGPVDLAVLGSGAEAAAHVRGLARVLSLRSLSVFSPSREKRESFALRFAEELEIEAFATDSAERAVAGANQVVTAARSYDETPILEADWLEDAWSVVSIGSTLPHQRELSTSVIEAADLIVADDPEELTEQTGDMLAVRARGIDVGSKLHSLFDLAQGAIPIGAADSRPSRVLFKSLGSGLQDIAVAELVAERCDAAGIGSEIAGKLAVKGR